MTGLQSRVIQSHYREEVASARWLSDRIGMGCELGGVTAMAGLPASHLWGARARDPWTSAESCLPGVTTKYLWRFVPALRLHVQHQSSLLLET